MTSAELPLLELFNRLREYGLPLGVDDYIMALRALQAGYGVGDRRAMEQLCCTLWTKSEDEAHLLHRSLEQLLTQPIVPIYQPLPETPESLVQAPVQSRLSKLWEAMNSLGSTIASTWSKLKRELDIERKRPPSEVDTEKQVTPERSSTGTPSPLLASTSALAAPASSGHTMELDEQMSVVKAVRRGAHGNLEMERSRFSLRTDYFPVKRRQMKQSWRYLRRMVREGPREELDILETVEKIGREGIVSDLVLVPRRSNQAELVMLIDQDGSMVPFHALSQQLIETAQRGGRLRQAGIYYFHDYPRDYLYRDPARLEAQAISDILTAIGERVAALIVSDAGAARGNLDTERVMRTKEFIQQLGQSVRYYAWLNPMPHERWPGTSASEIAHWVPMFEMSRNGLDGAISALRGRYVYWENLSS